MSVQSTKLDAVRGDTNIFSFAVASGLSLGFEVRLNNGTIVTEKSIGNGITEVTGGVEVTLSPGDTSSLAPVLHVLSYRLTGSSVEGVVTTLYQGPLYLFTNVVMP